MTEGLGRSRPGFHDMTCRQQSGHADRRRANGRRAMDAVLGRGSRCIAKRGGRKDSRKGGGGEMGRRGRGWTARLYTSYRVPRPDGPYHCRPRRPLLRPALSSGSCSATAGTGDSWTVGELEMGGVLLRGGVDGGGQEPKEGGRHRSGGIKPRASGGGQGEGCQPL